MNRKNSLLLIIVLFVFFVLLQIYTFSGVFFLLPYLWVPYVFCTILVCISYLLFQVIRRFSKYGMDLFFNIIVHILLILIVAELVFVVVLLAGDTYRLLQGEYIHLSQQTPFQLPLRSSRWIMLGVTLFFLTVVVFIYGMVRGKYAFKVQKHTLHFKDLPEAFDGFTICQISDVHAGSFTNAKAVQKGVDLVKAQQADLFVFTGDLVNNHASEIVPWIDHFAQITAPFGQFSVLGNHDYGDYIPWPSREAKHQNLEQLKAYHAQLGFRLLMDEHVEIKKDGEKIILAGIENWGIGFGERGDLQKALAHTAADDFKILLSHDPSHWDAEVKSFPSKIQLTLAGHTHGMQFGIEFWGIKWSPVKYRYKHWAGLKEEAGRYLYINRGFGFLGFSGRIGIWPEITVIQLRKEP